MSTTQNHPVTVSNNTAQSRFETYVDGQLAVADYRLGPATITFTHTGVPDGLAGRGIATQLIEAALAFARERRLRVIPACSFVAAYIRKHPGVQDLLDAQD